MGEVGCRCCCRPPTQDQPVGTLLTLHGLFSHVPQTRQVRQPSAALGKQESRDRSAGTGACATGAIPGRDQQDRPVGCRGSFANKHLAELYRVAQPRRARTSLRGWYTKWEQVGVVQSAKLPECLNQLRNGAKEPTPDLCRLRAPCEQAPPRGRGEYREDQCGDDGRDAAGVTI